jgi:D-sedoheptulose 7-phosphate isomerase
MSVQADIKIIRAELEQAKCVLETFLNNNSNLEQIEKAAGCFADALQKGNKNLSCGNGGSHCDAMHFAEELTGRYRDDRPGYAAIAISDSSHITCVGNDFGYDNVFARYVEAVGLSGDVLLGISTSGNSQTVIRAFREAKAKGIMTVALSGKDGGFGGYRDSRPPHGLRRPYTGSAYQDYPYSDHADRRKDEELGHTLFYIWRTSYVY